MTTQADKRARAAALLAAGRGTAETAREIGVDPSTIRRWRREFPAMFKQAEKPEELLRARLMAALDATHADGRPDYRIQLDAAEQLRSLDAAKSRGSGSGRVTVVLAEPGERWPTNRCPQCDAILANRVLGGISNPQA
jgi:transposase-like protein